MHDSLVKSIQALQKSKYGKGNKSKLTSIQSALKLATPLFTSTKSQDRGGNKQDNQF